MRKRLALACVLTAFCSFTTIHAVTLDDLRNDGELTPQKFASYFSDFKFDFRADIQELSAFLSSRSGDCDDYSVLASLVLKEKGYTPRLIAIRMPSMVHVVCHIAETNSYLDYNKRRDKVKTVSSDGSLQDIARQVAKSFKSPWTSVSEFTFESGSGMKRLVATVKKTDLYASSGRAAAH